jgi:hypothetical protein
VVALDAVGLLLFFIPGVIAFAVDFSNGTIYLPPDDRSFASLPGSETWHTVQVNPAELTPEKLEAVVREETGEPVCLEPGHYRAARISHIGALTTRALDRLKSAALPTSVIFRGTAE